MAQINYKSEPGKHLVCIKPEIRGENISETASAPHHRNPGHRGSGPGGVTAVSISRDTRADDTASEKMNLNLLPQRSSQGQVGNWASGLYRAPGTFSEATVRCEPQRPNPQWDASSL